MGKNKYPNRTNRINFRVTAAALIVGAVVVPFSLRAQVITVAPANMPRIGTVDERFQSFNIEMLEVTGGKFWKPYKDLDVESKLKPPANQSSSSTPAGMDPGMYKYRPPIDLTNSRLRKLAAALALPTCASVEPGRTPPTSMMQIRRHPPPHPKVLMAS